MGETTTQDAARPGAGGGAVSITPEDVEWVRLLAGNHTIDFNEFRRWAPAFYAKVRALAAPPAPAPGALTPNELAGLKNVVAHALRGDALRPGAAAEASDALHKLTHHASPAGAGAGEADGLDARVRLLSAVTVKKIDYDSEDGRLAIQLANEWVPAMGALLATFLHDAGAENYVEMQFRDPHAPEMYTVTARKVIGGKTPHQLRREAEAERDALAARLAERDAPGAPADARAREEGDGRLDAIKAAVDAIYFRDSADYIRALWSVLRALNPDAAERMEHRDEERVWREVTDAYDRSRAARRAAGEVG